MASTPQQHRVEKWTGEASAFSISAATSARRTVEVNR
jgi:hypothetical protein